MRPEQTQKHKPFACSHCKDQKRDEPDFGYEKNKPLCQVCYNQIVEDYTLPQENDSLLASLQRANNRYDALLNDYLALEARYEKLRNKKTY